MAARWLQAKKTKMRRAYLKRPRSFGPNSIALAEYQERGRSVSSPFLDRLFPGKKITQADVDKAAKMRHQWVLPSKGVQKHELQDPVPPPIRMLIMRAEHTLHQSEFFQRIHTWNNVTMVESAKFVIQMFFSGNSFRFREINFKEGRASISIVYKSRDLAMLAYNNRITWKETVKFTPG